MRMEVDIMDRIELRTLTPLWTGDIKRNSAHVKDTSIIGSLRWWYEAMMNKLGGSTCDPTSSPCSFSYKAYKKSGKLEDGLKEVCDVCKLFGCTGYRRRFRLKAGELRNMPLFFLSHQNVYLSNGNWLSRIYDGSKHRTNKGTSFSFKKRMLFSSNPFEIRIITVDINHDVFSSIYFLLWFASEYGGIGAKTQNGFGQVKMIGPNDKLLKEGKESIRNRVGIEQKNRNGTTFDLNDFFSVEYEIEDRNPYYGVGKEIGDPGDFEYRKYFIPCAFDVRYKMRSRNPFTKMGENWGMRPFFIREFGSNKEARQKTKSLLGDDVKRTSSRIFVSHLFKENKGENYHIKIWGFIPERIEKKERVVELVEHYICDRKTFYGARKKKEYKEKEVFS
jgi:CRISPR-associated protein Cmr1